MLLHEDADAAGVRLIAYDTLGSTNAQALTRARAGEQGPLWITAARQTAGRGRRGNAWASEPGNLHASLLLTDAAPGAHLPELCFVAALAARDAVLPFIPPLKGEGRIAEGDPGRGRLSGQPIPTRPASHDSRCEASASLETAAEGRLVPPLSGGGEEERLKLKWPNDLLLDGAKLAGILIEAESAGGRSVTVAGIGVNCAHHPSGTSYPATDLAAAGAAVTPEQLFHRLSGAMCRRLAQWDRGSGFAAIRAEWLAHAAGIGGDIVVRLPGRELTGTFETLDRMGRLMLRLPAGKLEAITVGEVFAPVGRR